MKKYFKYIFVLLVLNSCTSNRTLITSSENIKIRDYSSEGIRIYEDQLNTKYGYVTDNGEKITDAIYDITWNFKESLGAVAIGNNMGFIDKKGNLEIPLDYSQVKSFKNQLAIVSKNYLFGVIDRNNIEVIPCKYAQIGSKGNLAFISQEIPGKFGLLDRSGNQILQDTFEYIMSISDSLFLASKNKRFSIYNFRGTNTTQTDFDNVSIRFKDDLLSVKNEELSGYVNKQGALTIAPIYNKLDCVKHTCIVGTDKMNQVINAKTGDKISKEYDEIERVALLGLLTKSKDKVGLLYYDGKLILPPKYDEIRKHKSHHAYIEARQGAKWETYHKFRKMEKIEKID